MTQQRKPSLDVISHSPEQTRAIGALLGRSIERGSVILLGGMIGAGKTTFAQGLAHGLKVTTPVTSPTFTLVTEHDGQDATGVPIRLFHIDLYRLGGQEDVLGFGFEEYLDDPDSVAVIEWPERASGYLPADHLLVELADVADTKRSIAFIAGDGRYLPMLANLRKELAGARG